jgi:hypothetical protein
VPDAVPGSREEASREETSPALSFAIPAGFVPYAGDGYALLLPGKWNPSKEREFAGMDVRCVARRHPGARLSGTLPILRCSSAPAPSYEDNFDAVNNLFVIVKAADKSKIEVRGARTLLQGGVSVRPLRLRADKPPAWPAPRHVDRTMARRRPS